MNQILDRLSMPAYDCQASRVQSLTVLTAEELVHDWLAWNCSALCTGG